MRSPTMLPACLLLVGATAAAQDKLSEAAERLGDQVHALATVDCDDADFSDLEPLVRSIGTARIVVLGEATHGDGATSKAKTRFVRFLHERMGFDVVAWEAGLLDCRAMDAALRADVPIEKATREMMYGGWDASRAVRPLFEYARRSWRTPHPLEMAGFDGNRPPRGGAHVSAVLERLLAAAPELQLAPADRKDVNALIRRTTGYFSDEAARLSAELRRRQRDLVLAVIDGAAASPAVGATLSPRELEWNLEVLRSLLVEEELGYFSAQNMLHPDESADWGLRWNRGRDQQMAETLLWQLDHSFPGRKVIVWAATAHFIRNAASIDSLNGAANYRLFDQAGEILARALGPELYTIAFTSSGGECGAEPRAGERREETVGIVSPPPVDSLEETCHRFGRSFSFVDCRGAPPESWLRRPFVSVALGGLVNRAPWADVVDAFVVIDRQEPESYDLEG